MKTLRDYRAADERAEMRAMIASDKAARKAAAAHAKWDVLRCTRLLKTAQDLRMSEVTIGSYADDLADAQARLAAL